MISGICRIIIKSVAPILCAGAFLLIGCTKAKDVSGEMAPDVIAIVGLHETPLDEQIHATATQSCLPHAPQLPSIMATNGLQYHYYLAYINGISNNLLQR